MAEKQKRAREEGWGSERAMLAGCNLSFRIWMSSHLHFRAPSLDLHSLVVKAIDFKTDELLVRCNLSGVESDGHLHSPSRAKDARWAAHLQVRGAFEQAAQAGRKHREKQRCHEAACAPRETSGLLGALPSPLTASSGQEGLDGPSQGALSWHEVPAVVASLGHLSQAFCQTPGAQSRAVQPAQPACDTRPCLLTQPNPCLANSPACSKDVEPGHTKQGLKERVKPYLTSLSALFVMTRVCWAGGIPAW